MIDDPDLTLDPDQAATAERLERTLAAVAAAPAPPARPADLLARLDGATGDVPVVALATRDRRRRPLLLAAAALLVVAALAGALLVARGADDAAPDVKAEPGSVGTGWYLPPEGWAVTSVQTDHLDVGESGACPCQQFAAGTPGADPSTLDVGESDPYSGPEDIDPYDVEGARTVDVGGRDARAAGEDGHLTVVVVHDGRQLVAQARDVEEDVVVVLLDAWLDRRAAGQPLDVATLPLPAGWVRSGLVEEPAWRSEHLLAVRVRERATGRVTEIQVVPTGWNRALLWDPDHLASDGDALRVTVEDGAELWGASHGGAGLAGIIGGRADVVVGAAFFGEPVDPLSPTELGALLDGLREVGTAEWREALAGASGEVDPKVLRAPSLYEAPLTGT